MAVVRREMPRRGVAGGGAAIEVEADVEIVEVVDLPAVAVQGHLEPAAVLAVEQDARIERVGDVEEAQAHGAGGLDDQPRGDPLMVEEVRAQEELELAGLADPGLEGTVAERLAAQGDAAGRLGLLRLEGRVDDAAGEQRESGKQNPDGDCGVLHGVSLLAGPEKEAIRRIRPIRPIRRITPTINTNAATSSPSPGRRYPSG